VDRHDLQYGDNTQVLAPQKDKLVAGILGIVIGGLGIHRFYLGYIGIGIAQILVTLITFGVGAIWGLIEGILILVQDDWTDAQGRPLKGNEATNYLSNPSAQFASQQQSGDRVSQLKELSELKKSGLLTEDEFAREKQKILR
jgi:TM2 domain-containing membrane protein YozV|tara:strand:- start:177 stop:602 length:426 start_codon:yes stop_codon:yes gene_type:complete